MATFFYAVLILHIVAGMASLATGLIGMITNKGGKTHRKNGRIFFWAMAIVFITAFYMSLARSNWFLFMVAFFSFYLTCTGYRILYLKKLHTRTLKPVAVDWLIGLTGIISGIGHLVLAIYWLQNGNFMGIAPVFFGVVSLSLGTQDIVQFYKPPHNKSHWLRSHALRMAGAFAATVTAFLVVNVQIGGAQWVLWVLPGVLIPAVTAIQLRRRFAASRSERMLTA